MPYKDDEARRASNRRSYARNREKVIAKVAKRKRTDYAGTCQVCGGPTVGQSKNDIPTLCGKPECRSSLYKGHLFRPKGWKPPRLDKKTVMTIDELAEYHEKRQVWERPR